MGTFIANRLLQAIPVFFGSTFVIYALVFLLPGDPIQAMAGTQRLPEAVIQAQHERYNLGDPFLVQYGKYIGGVLSGDLGESFARRDVSAIIGESIPVTLRLTFVAVFIQSVFGIFAGMIAALRKDSWIDSLVLVSTTAVISVPVFVIAYVVQLGIGAQVDWLPISGTRDGWLSFLLPGFVLASTSMAYVARLLRSSLTESLQADYVRTATAKGLQRSRVVTRHALRNSMIGVVTFIGIDIGALMGGAIVTEGVFGLNGLGGAIFEAIEEQDTPIVVGIVTFLVLVFIVVNLVVDLLYGVLDPRVRHG